jgi:hypothetical protein
VIERISTINIAWDGKECKRESFLFSKKTKIGRKQNHPQTGKVNLFSTFREKELDKYRSGVTLWKGNRASSDRRNDYFSKTIHKNELKKR